MDLDIQPLAASDSPERVSGFLHLPPHQYIVSREGLSVPPTRTEEYTEKEFTHSFHGQFAHIFEALRRKLKPLPRSPRVEAGRQAGLLWPY